MAADPRITVVGAGPAGLATAIEARLRGLEVVVLDRRRPPLDKPCGEGLMPDGLARLTAMGVVLKEKDCAPFQGIAYIDGPLRVEGSFPEGIRGTGVRRLRLHRAMTARAEELGIPIRWGTAVEKVDPGSGRLTVRGKNGPEEHASRFVVVADGLRSPLRRSLGLQGSADPRPRFGARRHYAVEPWSRRVEVYWGDRCEAYVTPLGPREVGVAVLWGERKANFHQLLAEFPELSERLGEAPTLSEIQGTGPLRQKVRAVTKGRVALAGDAAGYVDAVTGEGLSVAFHQAEALGEALADGDLATYAPRRRAVLRLPTFLTELVLALERRPKLRRRVLRAMAADPGIFDRFLAVHARHGSVGSLLPVTPRMAWRLLRSNP